MLLASCVCTAQLPPALTSGPWKLTAIGFDYEGDGKADRDMWKPCRAGTTFTFNPDGSGSNYKGPQPCGNPGANPLPFTWVAEGPNAFAMKQGPNTEHVTIRSITQASLVLYMQDAKLLLTLGK